FLPLPGATAHAPTFAVHCADRRARSQLGEPTGRPRLAVRLVARAAWADDRCRGFHSHLSPRRRESTRQKHYRLVTAAIAGEGFLRHRLELTDPRGLRERPELVRHEAERRGEHDRDGLAGEMSGACSDEHEEEELVGAERKRRDGESACALAEDWR